MPRTSVSDVIDLLDETELDPQQVNGHLEAAGVVVDDIAATDATLGADRLELIERYLTAHFATTNEPRVSRETIGSGTWEYQMESSFIETAVRLDTTGIISGGGKPSAGIIVPDGRDLAGRRHRH